MSVSRCFDAPNRSQSRKQGPNKDFFIRVYLVSLSRLKTVVVAFHINLNTRLKE